MLCQIINWIEKRCSHNEGFNLYRAYPECTPWAYYDPSAIDNIYASSENMYASSENIYARLIEVELQVI